jgi:hypothetical protein
MVIGGRQLPHGCKQTGSAAASREATIGDVNATVNVNLDLRVHANVDTVLIDPKYVFTTPVLGGRFSLDMSGVVGNDNTGLDGTLTASSGHLR